MSDDLVTRRIRVDMTRLRILCRIDQTLNLATSHQVEAGVRGPRDARASTEEASAKAYMQISSDWSPSQYSSVSTGFRSPPVVAEECNN